MFIEMGMFMAKDAYGAPPDLSENMFSNCECEEEFESAKNVKISFDVRILSTE